MHKVAFYYTDVCRCTANNTYDYLLVSSDSQNTALTSLHSLKWSLFVMKARSASSAMMP